MSRVVVVGGPRTGKTTLAMRMSATTGHKAMHTDSLIGEHDWSGASLLVSSWFDQPGPWIVEGVAAVRALRKWLAANPDGKPCDRVIVCQSPRVELTPGQSAMSRGHSTIWAEVEPLLRRRGVAIEAA